ncbi:MAG: helix-hairpin-helix domain-containing protein, partial [Promethearchaeota archaeon]
MTELKDDLSDIKTYYKMAQGALQEKDIIEALKISEMGLRKAKSLHDNVWVSKFTELTTQIHYLDGDYNQFTANAIAKNRSALEELSHIEGVGVSVAEKLIDSGFDSIHAIASSTPAQLAQIRGIGPMTAQKIIENAISHSHIKSLNNFGNSSSDASSVDNNNQQNFEKKWFDEKFSRSKPNVWYSPSGSEVKEINNESYPSESTNRSYENELIEE